MSAPPAVIFDFDGTVADSVASIFEIARELARESGRRVPDWSELPELRTLPTREIMRRFEIHPARLPGLLWRGRRRFRERLPLIAPVPGIEAVLWALKDQGFRLGLASTNSPENIELFTQRHGLPAWEMSAAGGGLFGKNRLLRRLLSAYELDPRRTAVVGDEVRDVEAARAVGVKAIAVTWGFQSSAALALAKPDALIESPGLLPAALVRLFG